MAGRKFKYRIQSLGAFSHLARTDKKYLETDWYLREGHRVEVDGRQLVVEDVAPPSMSGYSWLTLREPPPAPPPWEGQRFYVRRPGPGAGRREELTGLRNTDAAIGYRPGQELVLQGRRYTVAAVEDDGDTILLDGTD